MLPDLDLCDDILNVGEISLEPHHGEQLSFVTNGAAHGKRWLSGALVRGNLVELYALLGFCEFIPRTARCVELIQRYDTLLAVEEGAVCFAWETHIDGINVRACSEVPGCFKEALIRRYICRPYATDTLEDPLRCLDYAVDLLGMELRERAHLAFRRLFDHGARFPVGKHCHRSKNHDKRRSDPQQHL